MNTNVECGFDLIESNNDFILEDRINTLDKIKYQIAELSRIKEELEQSVAKMLEHNKNTSKTYLVGKYSVTVTTGFNYRINKKEYEVIKDSLPKCFNPVYETVSLKVRESIWDEVHQYGDEDDIAMLKSYISRNPAKLHVKIGSAD